MYQSSKIFKTKEVIYMHFNGTIWRPPYEAYSNLVQVTAGCTHNACKFCTLYEDVPFKFRMSPLSEVEEDLKELNNYNQGVKRFFFTGANPFVLRTDKLKELANMVKKYFPYYESIGCFARVTDITPKTVEELKELRAFGYTGITIGVETGDDTALAFMNKGYTSDQIISECRKLEAAGIEYNFFYLTGISGAGQSVHGALETTKIFNQLHPRKIEVSMLTVFPNSKLYEEIEVGNYTEASELERLIEQKTLIENLDIHTIFLANTKSNTARLEGELPRDKEKLVVFLKRVIASGNEADLAQYRKAIQQL